MIVEVSVRVMDPESGVQVCGAMRQQSIVTTPDADTNTLRVQAAANELMEGAMESFYAQCDQVRAGREEPPARGHGRRR